MKTLIIELDDETAAIIAKLGSVLSTGPEGYAAECIEEYIGMVRGSGAMELEGTSRIYDTMEEAKAAVQLCQEMDGSEYSVSYFETPNGMVQPEYCAMFKSERRKDGWKELAAA